MPIYSYHCKACDGTFKTLAKMSDPAPTRCDLCQAEGLLTKQLSRTSFQLKGGGWYNEGYSGASNQSASTPSDSKSESNTSSSSTGGNASTSGT